MEIKLTRIEKALKELAQMPSPPQLAGMEAQVWERVSATALPGWGWRVPATAMAAALMVGVVTGLQPAPAVAMTDMDALSVRPALLPSTLLATS